MRQSKSHGRASCLSSEDSLNTHLSTSGTPFDQHTCTDSTTGIPKFTKKFLALRHRVVSFCRHRMISFTGHYPLRSCLLRHPKRTRQPPYWTVHSLSERDVPLAQVSIPAQLAPYWHQIQGWFHIYGDCQVAASLLRPYYTALTDVVRHIVYILE